MSLTRLALTDFRSYADALIAPGPGFIILTGIYQTQDAWSFGDPWISASFAIIIVVGGILGAYFVPTDRKLAAMAERDLESGGLSDEYQAAAKRIGQVGGLAGFLIILAIFLMVTKPGA